jgi:hypothetical protein
MSGRLHFPLPRLLKGSYGPKGPYILGLNECDSNELVPAMTPRIIYRGDSSAGKLNGMPTSNV